MNVDYYMSQLDEVNQSQEDLIDEACLRYQFALYSSNTDLDEEREVCLNLTVSR